MSRPQPFEAALTVHQRERRVAVGCRKAQKYNVPGVPREFKNLWGGFDLADEHERATCLLFGGLPDSTQTSQGEFSAFQEDKAMSRLQIRDARPSDRDAIRAVTLAAYQEYAPLMRAHWEGYRRNILATMAEVKPAEQIVADQDGKVVGAVLLYPAGTVFSSADGAQVTLRWPEVRLLAVAPEARGQGLGAALMRECVRRARQGGAGALTLHTTDIMQVAIRMYERMGFVRAPELDFHPAPEVTVKGYRLDLAETAL